MFAKEKIMKRIIDLAISKNLKHYLKIFEISGLSIIFITNLQNI